MKIISTKKENKKSLTKTVDETDNSDNQKLSKEQDLELQLKKSQEQYVRLQAEFANYKRRTDEEKSLAVNVGVAKALKAFINVFDDFELALKNKTDNVKDYQEGMKLLFAKLVSTSEELGVLKIKTKGEQFDPVKHEALLTEVSDKPEQEILEELQSGYLFNSQVLRTAKVKVAKK